MIPSFASFVAMVRDTFTDPRATMRKVLNLGLPLVVSVEILVLLAVISAVLSELSMFLAPAIGNAEMVRGMAGGPIRVLILQTGLLAVVVVGVHRIGRAMGGKGELAGSVLVVAWLQVVMIALQLLQMVALVLVPPLASLIGLASVGVFFWMMTNFVAELHGFLARGRVFGFVLVGFMALAMALAFLLTFLGFVPPMEV